MLVFSLHTFLSLDGFGRWISESQSFHFSEVLKSVTNISARLLYIMDSNRTKFKNIFYAGRVVLTAERSMLDLQVYCLSYRKFWCRLMDFQGGLKATSSNRTLSPYSNYFLVYSLILPPDEKEKSSSRKIVVK